MGNITKTPEELKKEFDDKKEAEAKRVSAEKEVAKIEAAEKEAAKKKAINEAKLKNEVVLYNLLGKKVANEDYFYKGVIPAGFVGTCGKQVDREDLIELFHKVFKPEDNILFYKQQDKEVYLVIIPIKYATTIGEFNDSIEGEFQKHAISFLKEGAVNLDTMRKKLERVNNFVNYSDR